MQYFYWYEADLVIFVKASKATRQQVLLTDELMNILMNRMEASKLHVIADWSDVSAVPSLDIFTKKIHYPKHPKYGWTVIMGLSTPLAFVMSITNQFFQVPVKQVRDLPEAIEFLRKGGIDCESLRLKVSSEFTLLAIIHDEHIQWIHEPHVQPE